MVAPGIVGIGGNGGTGGIHDPYHIPLKIGYIVVDGAVMGDGHGCAGGIVGEVEGVAALFF